GGDHGTTHGGAHRIADVEGGVVEGGREGLRPASDIHEADLQGRHQGGAEETDQPEVDGAGHRVVGGEVEADEHHHDADECEQDAAVDIPVRQASPNVVADDHAHAVGHEHHPDQGGRHPGLLGHGPGDVGVHGEH